MQCRNCECKQIHRMKRSGFLQNRVYPLFGFYPWKCPECKTRYLLRARGSKHRKGGSRSGAEAGASLARQ